MCVWTGKSDAKIIAEKMVERGASEEEMISAEPVIDSVPPEDNERVWRTIVDAARGS